MGAELVAETPATELRRGGHLGVRFEGNPSVWSGTIGAFHEDKTQAADKGFRFKK
jgi:hypothetical protein